MQAVWKEDANSTSWQRLSEIPCQGEFFCKLEMDQEILLLYWPQEPRTVDACGLNIMGGISTSWKSLNLTPKAPVTFKTNALTFKGQDLYHLGAKSHFLRHDFNYVHASVMTGPFTFTSPSVYIAHRNITSNVGMWLRLPGENGQLLTRIFTLTTSVIRSQGVFAVHSTDITTLAWEKIGSLTDNIEYAKYRAQGSFLPQEILDEREVIYLGNHWKHRLLDFRDLQTPLPAYLYYDAREDCIGQQSHCQTITEDNYRPSIILNQKIWNSMLGQFSTLLPAGITCVKPKLVDPPIVLPIITDRSQLSFPELPKTGSPQITTTSNSIYVIPTPIPTPGAVPFLSYVETITHLKPSPIFGPRKFPNPSPSSDGTESGRNGGRNPRDNRDVYYKNNPWLDTKNRREYTGNTPGISMYMNFQLLMVSGSISLLLW
jgi:hypothetical protein